MSVLIHDFNEMLSAAINGHPENLPAVVPYSNYINWLGTINREASLAYWKDYLANYSEIAAVPFKVNTEDTTYVESNESLLIDDDLFKKVDVW